MQNARPGWLATFLLTATIAAPGHALRAEAPRPRAVFDDKVEICWNGMCFSPNGKLLATGNAVGGIRLWDVAGGRLRDTLDPGREAPEQERYNWQCSPRYKWVGNYRRDWALAVAFSPDSKLLATGGLGKNRQVRLWDVSTGQVTARLDVGVPSVRDIEFAPDGRTLAICDFGHEGIVRLWGIPSGEFKTALHSGRGTLQCLAYSPDGRYLAACGWGDHRSVRIWDARTGRVIAKLPPPKAEAVTCLRFSPDGRWLATTSRRPEGIVRLWYVEDMSLRAEMDAHVPAGGTLGNGVCHVAFSPDSRFVAACQGTRVKFWSLSGKLHDVALEHNDDESGPTCAAFSPDGGTLATATGEGWIRLWDVRTILGKFEGPDAEPRPR